MEQDRYLPSRRSIGRMGGADWVPTATAELDEYVENDAGTTQRRTHGTREFVDFLMTSPFFSNLPGPVDRQLHRVRDLRGHEPRTAVGAAS